MSSGGEILRGAALEPIPVTARKLEADPHGVFRHYRRLTPVIERDDGVYIAIRAVDVERLGSDPRTRQLETEYVLARGVSQGPLFDFAKHAMQLSNRPEHRRRRAPLARTFTFEMIDELRPKIRGIAAELVDEGMTQGGMNLVADYCARVPARVLAMILGLPAADVPEFTRHVYSLARLFTPRFSGEMAPELQDSARQLLRYVEDLLNERGRHPRKDFLTSYLGVIQEPHGPAPVDALAQVLALLVGGSDTTRTALAIQVSLLLQHPQQWQAVCRNPALVPGAVLESLRYEPAVGSFSRRTLEDVGIDGWVVPANRTLSLSTLSAMRDPAIYSDPEVFDITRPARRHPVFGAGPHRCLGEALAKAELEEGLAALSARLPDLQLAGEPPTVNGSDGLRTIQDRSVRHSGDSWVLVA